VPVIYTEHSFEQIQEAEEMVGSGGMEYYRYRALQEGKTEIKMIYGQHWDGGYKNPAWVFNVKVDP